MNYDYRKIRTWLEKVGEDHIGRKFEIPENEKATIKGILVWFLEDEVLAEKMNIDLKKGIMLPDRLAVAKPHFSS
ncbi:hypothetical protein [Chryseobacterium taklimakanense]|uniref:hypothetical protein n=1 Tax=Chryseobacterium taklimakanense TaxID=536441 RepID=UPI001E3F6222|nr:hypothetical protein [Chryseobacterium taklimakanense]